MKSLIKESKYCELLFVCLFVFLLFMMWRSLNFEWVLFIMKTLCVCFTSMAKQCLYFPKTPVLTPHTPRLRKTSLSICSSSPVPGLITAVRYQCRITCHVSLLVTEMTLYIRNFNQFSYLLMGTVLALITLLFLTLVEMHCEFDLCYFAKYIMDRVGH